ncbi:zinc finger, CCHC-type containing protein [Tanacetum coccineum]
MDAAMKQMVSNFSKLDKFEWVKFKRWQKKMHFLLFSMSVVYVLTTPIPEDGENATMEQIRKRVNHLRIEESLRVQDSDKPKCNNVAGPSVVNMVEHDNSSRYNKNKGKSKHHDNTKDDLNKKAKPTCWKCGKTGHIKRDCKDVNVGNKANGPSTNVSVDGSSNSLKAFMPTSKLNDLILWHAILGHVYFKRMQDMYKDGLIPTFDMDAVKCKTCMLTKITKKPFQNVKRKTKVLELIHNDLCDLHATPSLGNKRYFVIFIDDASRFCYVYLLHSKDEALDKFKVFKTEVELQQGSLIKRFRTVRGGEYMDTLTESRVLRKPNLNYLMVWGCKAVVRLPDPKLKNVGERGIECIFVGYLEHSKAFKDVIFDENKSSLVPRPSQRSLVNETEDIGGSVVPEDKEVTDEGFRQKSWIDYFDTYDPVARISIIRLLIALASIHNLIIHQMDVKTTFLYGKLDEEIYMNQPQGFIMPGNENKVFSMKDIGEANVILRIRIKHVSNEIEISQSHYIEKVLKKFNYFDCTLVSTPMDTSEKLMPNDSQYVSQLEYSRVIACLMYAMTCTRCNFLGIQEANLHYQFNKESEFVALETASKEAEWLRNLILEIPLSSKPIVPISIRCDSLATLAKAYSQMYNGKYRHVGVMHSMIRELIMNGVVSIDLETWELSSTWKVERSMD